MMAKEGDAKAVARAVAGHEASQREVYEAYHTAASRLAYLLLQDAMDAEEVVQDAFVYAFRNMDRYDAERGAFWTWLRVILVSRCRNKRRRKRLPHVSLEVLNGLGQPPADTKPLNDPADAVERRDTHRVLIEALNEVSPGARDALVLRYYEGLPYAEIAGILGCSSGAARSRVAHGKVQLRRLLSTGGEKSVAERGVVGAAKVG